MRTFSRSPPAAVALDSTVELRTWDTVVTNLQFRSFRAGQWGNLHVVGHSNTSVGFTHRYGLRVVRVGLMGSGTLTDSACNLRVRVDNRQSATPPFDE